MKVQSLKVPGSRAVKEAYLRQLAPGELYRPVALHHDGLVLHGSLHHHKVVQHLIPDGGVQPLLANLLVKTRRSWGSGQMQKLTSVAATDQ